MDESPTLNGLRESDIRAELERILRSRAFVHSHRIRRFLQFVVEECLLGQHHRLKEYLIGLEVFNRQEAFDPRVDSIVRVEARRLRTKLEEYYLTEGHEDEIRIHLRKGSYVPVFEHRRPGVGPWPGFAPTAARRAIGVGSITVFNGGASHDAAVEDVKRRVSHVLIKEGYFLVTGATASNGTAEPEHADRGPEENTVGPDYMVEGSMHFHPDRVSVILQLRSAAEATYIWSEQIECKLDDLSPVEELARSLNRTLITTAATSEAARARRHGADRHSFDYYLQGRYHWKLGTPESIRSSVPLFAKAVERDPGYAAAWAALSESLLVSSVFGLVSPGDSIARMKEAAAQAVRLNDHLPEAHVAQGAVMSILDWDWSAGERELQHAVQLAPTDPAAHVAYGLQLACRRMLDAAMAEIECALELDPALLFTNFALGWMHSICGRHDEAMVQHRLVAQLAPDFPLSYLGLGWAHIGKGLFHDAIAHFTNASNLLRSRTLLSGCLGYCYARSNDRDEALRQLLLLDNSNREDDSSRHMWPVSAASIYAGLGDKDRALTYLEEAVEARNTSVPLRTLNPEFNSIRTEPRFQALLRNMGIG
jgi:tetratricopeptide (TPR) repeat protein